MFLSQFVAILLCTVFVATATARSERKRRTDRQAFALGPRIEIGAREKAAFDYVGERGPDHWRTLFPGCSGKEQSPVNLRTKTAITLSMPVLVVPNINWFPSQVLLTNTGFTAKLTSHSPPPSFLRGGPLKGMYAFDHMHFHWGQSNTMGSEHALDGNFYAMELQVIFYKTSFENFTKAVKMPDGVIALAIFLELGPVENEALEPVVSALQRVEKEGTMTTLDEELSTGELFLQKWSDLYVYRGSLTTPPCNEVVTWFVFSHPISVSPRQVEAFRTLQTQSGSLSSNRRPPQPMNGRPIYKAATGRVAPGPLYLLCGLLLRSLYHL